jgi:hypothetical protein
LLWELDFDAYRETFVKKADLIPPLEDKVFLLLFHFLSDLHFPEFESFSELFKCFRCRMQASEAPPAENEFSAYLPKKLIWIRVAVL